MPYFVELRNVCYTSGMKKKLLVLLILSGVVFGVWYAYNAGWFQNTGPDNLPTAEERARMAEIDRTSATVAPDATPGVGVRPAGSTPQAPEPTETNLDATSTNSSTTEPTMESEVLNPEE
jgi:hypothetical protein